MPSQLNSAAPSPVSFSLQQQQQQQQQSGQWVCDLVNPGEISDLVCFLTSPLPADNEGAGIYYSIPPFTDWEVSLSLSSSLLCVLRMLRMRSKEQDQSFLASSFLLSYSGLLFKQSLKHSLKRLVACLIGVNTPQGVKRYGLSLLRLLLSALREPRWKLEEERLFSILTRLIRCT